MVSDNMKAGMDNIVDWTKFDNEVDSNTFESGTSDSVFPNLFSDKNLPSTEGLMRWFNSQAKSKGGEVHFKREFINKLLHKIDSATDITRGYFISDGDEVDKVNSKGEVVMQTLKNGTTKPIRVPNEKSANKNRPHYSGVGQLRGTYRQFFPDATVTTNVKNDYIRITRGD